MSVFIAETSPVTFESWILYNIQCKCVHLDSRILSVFLLQTVVTAEAVCAIVQLLSVWFPCVQHYMNCTTAAAVVSKLSPVFLYVVLAHKYSWVLYLSYFARFPSFQQWHISKVIWHLLYFPFGYICIIYVGQIYMMSWTTLLVSTDNVGTYSAQSRPYIYCTEINSITFTCQL